MQFIYFILQLSLPIAQGSYTNIVKSILLSLSGGMYGTNLKLIVLITKLQQGFIKFVSYVNRLFWNKYLNNLDFRFPKYKTDIFKAKDKIV